MTAIESPADSHLAFEAAVTPHLDIAWRLANALLKKGPDAEDVFQDALIKAWRNWSTVRDPTKVRSWLWPSSPIKLDPFSGRPGSVWWNSSGGYQSDQLRKHLPICVWICCELLMLSHLQIVAASSCTFISTYRWMTWPASSTSVGRRLERVCTARYTG